MNRCICIHGHFYQPPRENPWLEAVEPQDSAYPYHDWNDRVSAECYGPNTASRILDPERRIIDIVNNYSSMSFDMGPTLLSWLEKSRPEIYLAILEADRAGRERFSGHGPAIAQAYSHLIMPLASGRDKRTQVLWGLRDFEHRFRRPAEGMWLPETAVDLETLDILAEHGMRFTVLAPHQAARFRRTGAAGWEDAAGPCIDPRRPYRCSLPSGRSIALFFYDGPIARDIAFNGLLENGELFAGRLLAAFDAGQDAPQLVHIATDGETYGHHHRYGDMALSYCLYHLETNDFARITVYGQYLEQHPPEFEVEIIENSSWSCAHGVERWRGDCGCFSGQNPGWQQRWRAPLRGAMDWLRDNLAGIFADLAGGLLADPWQARDSYINVVLDRAEGSVRDFFGRHAARDLTQKETMTALKLLEMQRCGLLMYTSCGWFFDEVSGIEPVQVMRYAARAMQLARGVSSLPLEEAFCALLENASSNIDDIGTGAEVYRRFVQPAELDLLRVGAHYAVSSLFTEHPETAAVYCYTITRHAHERLDAGRQKMAIGRIRVRSDVTLEEALVSFAVLHLGDHTISGGVRLFISDEAFGIMAEAVRSAFQRGDVTQAIYAIVECFGSNNYSLWHLFREEQRAVVGKILKEAHREILASYRQIYERYYPVMQALEGLGMPLPGYFCAAAELIVNTDLLALFENEEFNAERLDRLAAEAARWKLQLDRPRLALCAGRKIDAAMQRLAAAVSDTALMDDIIHLLSAAATLQLGPDNWKAQNIYFSIGGSAHGRMQQSAARGNRASRAWIACFEELGNRLGVRCPP